MQMNNTYPHISKLGNGLHDKRDEMVYIDIDVFIW